MNAPTFDSPAPLCPICHRAGVTKPHKLFKGLLTCQNCRERLVVSWSGHYVRDPFTVNQLAIGSRLRRESRPLARLWRDYWLANQLLMWVVTGSVVLLGTSFLIASRPVTDFTLPKTDSTPSAPSNPSPQP